MERYRSYVLPFAILLGIFFHSYIVYISQLVVVLIFITLFFTFSNIEVRKMRLSKMDMYLLLFQLIGAVVFFYAIRIFNETIAQGVLVTILTPTATSAVVVGVLLGANVHRMGIYTFLCNIVIAIVAPLYFSFMSNNINFSFWQSFGFISAKVAPLLLLPFVLAVIIRFLSPRLNAKIVKNQSISFYLWALALTIVIAQVIDSFFNENNFDWRFMLWAVVASLLLCTLQFALGKYVGKRHGDKIAGGQLLGQKNTVLAIWMAQTFFYPTSSIIPAFYVIFQNLYNSFQLWQKEINRRKQLE